VAVNSSGGIQVSIAVATETCRHDEAGRTFRRANQSARRQRPRRQRWPAGFMRLVDELHPDVVTIEVSTPFPP